jgi:predicted Zn-ribbon and HTH transcriptional regulator
MTKTASLRFASTCPHCKVPLIEPEWSESVEYETVNFWHCGVCGFNFETIDGHVIQSSRTDFIDKYFSHQMAP